VARGGLLVGCWWEDDEDEKYVLGREIVPDNSGWEALHVVLRV
jgi:hypothetical protein